MNEGFTHFIYYVPMLNSRVKFVQLLEQPSVLAMEQSLNLLNSAYRSV
jgi:hypothetical protein